jgi:hypothetical protein
VQIIFQTYTSKSGESVRKESESKGGKDERGKGVPGQYSYPESASGVNVAENVIDGLFAVVTNLLHAQRFPVAKLNKA